MVIAFKLLVRDGEADVCVLCFDLGIDLVSSREIAFLGFQGVIGGFGVRGPGMRPRKFRPEAPGSSPPESLYGRAQSGATRKQPGRCLDREPPGNSEATREFPIRE
ncbi:hypothetical protein L6452_35766 [Arctium lappa]|uniref:Uncharacterized protein n=1 Tax=Arctium lappa TaxID=4217 RepID=A0ACB8Y887_ARCLA|nr:hypothetical protein L6452_35766 [Arctium lappa]